MINDLIVLDIANNHQGSVEHGLKLIKEHGKILKKNNVHNVAFKFQFRDLDTFIHKKFKGDKKVKHINRFESTKLNLHEYKVLFDEIKANGFLTMCTPFDEISVDAISQMNFDLIKVASCSADDWPLLEKVSTINLPTVISTGGIDIEQIDKIVSFAEHRRMDISLMHCVSIYPMNYSKSNLMNIKMLKNRFPNLKIGWSTHEDPKDSKIVMIAKALGAEIFERHVGLENKNVKLNAYSSSPKDVDNWLKSIIYSNTVLGSEERIIYDEETKSLDELKRGVYLKSSLNGGSKLNKNDVYFAMPKLKNQINAGDFKQGIVLKKKNKNDEILVKENIIFPKVSKTELLYHYVHKVKAMLNLAKIDLGNEFNVEYSHHYGVKKFKDIGCILIECINREYCKKILIQLPGQDHPFHYHKLKEETFQVLSGIMNLNIDGREKKLIPGDTALVLPGTWHKFNTKAGFIAEEISTTHYSHDSVYKDSKINDMKREERKTIVKHWGRFEIFKKLNNTQ